VHDWSFSRGYYAKDVESVARLKQDRVGFCLADALFLSVNVGPRKSLKQAIAL